MGVVEIKDQDQFTKLTTTEANGRLVCLYLFTQWAEPCQTMNEVFKVLSDESSNENILFLSVDADEFGGIAELFNVSAVPYFIIIHNETILNELSGADPNEFIKALEECKANLNKASDVSKVIGNGNNDVEEEDEEEEEEEETEEELNERLTKLTQAAPVMLFMKGNPSEPKCGFSRQIVGVLREHQVRFGFFDILKDDSVRNGLKKFSDWPTFPQLYINGEFQGGLDIIKESLEEDNDYFQNALQS